MSHSQGQTTMNDFEKAQSGGDGPSTVKPPLPHLEQQEEEQETTALVELQPENQLQATEQEKRPSTAQSEQLPPSCGTALTCSDCLSIGKSSKEIVSCYWDGKICLVGKPGEETFSCPPVYYESTTTSMGNVPSSSHHDSSDSTTVSMWLEQATESSFGYVLVALTLLGGLFFLRKKGYKICSREGKGPDIKYETLSNNSPPMSSRNLIKNSRFMDKNSGAFNNLASESVPLSTHSLSSADEEWGWEEGESHVEMAGMPKSYNFHSSAVTTSSYTSSFSRGVEEANSGLTISGLDIDLRPVSTILSESRNTPLSFTADNISSSLAASGIPAHITSLGPKVLSHANNNNNNIAKPKPLRQEEDIFATLGLSVKPTFGSASSSVISMPKKQPLSTKTSFTNPSAVSYELSAPGNSMLEAAAKKYSQEADSHSFHSSGAAVAAAEWGEDDDLDDLLKD